MTELEFQQAKRAYALMTRPTAWGRLRKWLSAMFSREGQALKRRTRMDRKAEVERKARQAL